jgi:hypothetical protein
MCWLLPANTSHFLQPLDDTVFANFKRILTSLVEKVRLQQDATPLQLKMSLYQCAYSAEREAFTPRVIQRAFLTTGIFPFNPERILNLLALNSANGAKQTRSEHISIMVKSVKHMFKGNEKNELIQQRKIRVSNNQLFSPFELIAAADDEEERAREAKQAKEDARAAKLNQQVAKRRALTCVVDGCGARTRKECGAKGWGFCIACGVLFCKEHADELEIHTSVCTGVKVEDNESGLI